MQVQDAQEAQGSRPLALARTDQGVPADQPSL